LQAAYSNRRFGGFFIGFETGRLILSPIVYSLFYFKAEKGSDPFRALK
jgi:hypothetical protein